MIQHYEHGGGSLVHRLGSAHVAHETIISQPMQYFIKDYNIGNVGYIAAGLTL